MTEPLSLSTLTVLLLLGAALLVGAALGWLASRVRAASARAEQLADSARLEATVRGLEMQLDGAQARLSEAADRERRESRLAEQLAPMRHSVQQLQGALTEMEQLRNTQHGALSEQLLAQARSEESLRRTAESLAAALSSNATRGVWGETQLRRVVEAAGLIDRVDFDTQVTGETDRARIRPDMVVRLPGDKAIAIDAKVPFDAYLAASRIPATAEGEAAAERVRLRTAHAKALRAHIDALANKAYWEGVDGSPELVVAFIPAESLVAAALEIDPAILDYAFGKRVALASPVTLWSLLKAVAMSWSHDTIADDAQRVHDLAKELYGRIATLAGHADKLRASIASTVANYNAFAASLESRVLVSARKLADGAPIAEPAQVDAAPRALTTR